MLRVAQGCRVRVVEKKTDSGPDFRLTRSRHPSASGTRIGSSPGDGWAARRGPKWKRGVFYDAGLYVRTVKGSHNVVFRKAPQTSVLLGRSAHNRSWELVDRASRVQLRRRVRQDIINRVEIVTAAVDPLRLPRAQGAGPGGSSGPGACVGAGCPLSVTRLRLSGAFSAGGGKGWILPSPSPDQGLNKALPPMFYPKEARTGRYEGPWA